MEMNDKCRAVVHKGGNKVYQDTLEYFSHLINMELVSWHACSPAMGFDMPNENYYRSNVYICLCIYFINLPTFFESAYCTKTSASLRYKPILATCKDNRKKAHWE